ncbi:SAM-dependent methyltransferase [Nocardiopsis ansamitocini]|uniref:Cyclopropane-fatty-acyl-phospholipid synthase n=1 Tax=Nocardiopsis ansamitocini TaxID=1670832 RepID=A0A9W6P7L2_9ACTN|nr:cyclopropane-fatty-acyl-phospholipid synthase family protein [Nocardiopsis ansamitocini]GLU48501.1 cyclopropane-fatty-acyl-phospholipid synthase [Nocardiopsis ansamitocini]
MTLIQPPPSIDAKRWPDVAHAPTAVVRAPIARALVVRALSRLPIRVECPDPAMRGAGDAAAPVLRLHHPDAFCRRLSVNGLIGFGESYMAGEWDASDLPALLQVFAASYFDLIPRPLQKLRTLAMPLQPRSERNTKKGARSNIHRHYDLSNELFSRFLDETMTYSSALFQGAATQESLPGAQHRKIDRLLDLTSVGAGTELLEIGTGWGELAIRAAQRGARVRSVTLSSQQRDLALQRARRAGVADRVEVELCDYRDVRGSYDAVVSVEMIEAVGERYWPVYFTTLDRLTRPGGRVGLQAITMGHEAMRASRTSYTWIHKYIFPGGLIPSVRAIEEQTAARTALRMVDRHAFGIDYAETLRLWRERFSAGADDIQELGFDPVFQRMWEFYLAYSEAGFRSGLIDVEQLILERGR